MYFVLNKQIKTPIDLKRIPKNIIKIPINPDSFTILKSKKRAYTYEKKNGYYKPNFTKQIFDIFHYFFIFNKTNKKIKIIKINKIFIN